MNVGMKETSESAGWNHKVSFCATFSLEACGLASWLQTSSSASSHASSAAAACCALVGVEDAELGAEGGWLATLPLPPPEDEDEVESGAAGMPVEEEEQEEDDDEAASARFLGFEPRLRRALPGAVGVEGVEGTTFPAATAALLVGVVAAVECVGVRAGVRGGASGTGAGNTRLPADALSDGRGARGTPIPASAAAPAAFRADASALALRRSCTAVVPAREERTEDDEATEGVGTEAA